MKNTPCPPSPPTPPLDHLLRDQRRPGIYEYHIHIKVAMKAESNWPRITHTHVHTRAACGPKLARRLPGYRWPGNVVLWSRRKTWRVRKTGPEAETGLSVRWNRAFFFSCLLPSSSGGVFRCLCVQVASPRLCRSIPRCSEDGAPTAALFCLSDFSLARCILGPLCTSPFLSCISNAVVPPRSVWACLTLHFCSKTGCLRQRVLVESEPEFSSPNLPFLFIYFSRFFLFFLLFTFFSIFASNISLASSKKTKKTCPLSFFSDSLLHFGTLAAPPASCPFATGPEVQRMQPPAGTLLYF